MLAVVALVAGACGGGGGDGGTDPGARPSADQGEPSDRAEEARSGCVPVLGEFEAGRWPPGCWRPYAESSRFNTPIPAGAPAHPQSDAMVEKLTNDPGVDPATGGPDNLWLNSEAGMPVYWPRPDDPLYTLRCTGEGRCEEGLDGRQVAIPSEARPAGGSDAHLTVVDQRTNLEYDFWNVTSKPEGGGTMVFGGGGTVPVDGTGTRSGATASGFGNLAGIVRAEELERGRIDHALVLVVHCVSGVAPPATHSDGVACPAGTTGAPRMGERFQLAMSPREIDALDVPEWRRTILRAMARYGLYVRDTTGAGWAIGVENGRTYTSFGRPDRWTVFAEARDGDGWARDDQGFWVGDLRAGVPWRERLRAVHPCVAAASC
jgi:hypothetical protein